MAFLDSFRAAPRARCNDLKQVLAKIVDREPDLRLAA